MAKTKTKIITVEVESYQTNKELKSGVKRALEASDDVIVTVRSVSVQQAQAPKPAG